VVGGALTAAHTRAVYLRPWPGCGCAARRRRPLVYCPLPMPMQPGTTRDGRKPHPLAIARQERGISLRALADQIGMTHVALSHVETMRSEPKLRTMRKLEQALGQRIDWPQPSQNGKHR
jgi:DNA-binding XRE family transcriptional regulator